MSFLQIIEGWRNNLVPPEELKELIQATAKARILTCEGCEYHSKNHFSIRPDDHCTNCGCTLSAKTKCLSCECPIKKWLAVVEDGNVDVELSHLKNTENEQ